MALLERDCVLVSKSDSGQTIIDLPVTHVNNVEGLGRCPGTNYSAGDVVYSSSNMQLALLCTTGGTTAETDLDISANNVGDAINDGTVTWIVAKRNYFDNSGVLPIANGGTGANNASDACANLGAVRSVNGVSADSSGNVVLDTMPTGTVIPFASDNIPSGYLPCNGSAISRETYADLFAVIGTTYGAGDGSTTFNLPNLNNNSFLEGSNTAGTVKSAGLPEISGKLAFKPNAGIDSYLPVAHTSGAFTSEIWSGTHVTATLANFSNEASAAFFNASNSNAIYGNSNTVQPKSVTVKFCIKY